MNRFGRVLQRQVRMPRFPARDTSSTADTAHLVCEARVDPAARTAADIGDNHPRRRRRSRRRVVLLHCRSIAQHAHHGPTGVITSAFRPLTAATRIRIPQGMPSVFKQLYQPSLSTTREVLPDAGEV